MTRIPTLTRAAPGTDEHLATGTVVVGVDGTEPSGRALEWALRRAADLGVRCHVVRACPPHAERKSRAAARLDVQVAATLRRLSACDVTVRQMVVPGSAAAVLRAAASDAALLVVGTRGRSAVAEAVLGSVSEDCLRHPPCPVVVVPPTARVDSALGRIVVGVGGPTSVPAVAWAAAESARTGSQLLLVHAWRVPWASSSPFAPISTTICKDAGTAELVSAAEAALHVTARVSSVLVLEAAQHALCREGGAADLVVVGGRHLGPSAGALLDSVSQSCARHAPCPVVVVPGVDR